MSPALQELDDFIIFARDQLTTGDAMVSLEDCVRLWRERQERAETVADVIQGMRDDDAGLGMPLDEAFAAIRRQLGIR